MSQRVRECARVERNQTKLWGPPEASLVVDGVSVAVLYHLPMRVVDATMWCFAKDGGFHPAGETLEEAAQVVAELAGYVICEGGADEVDC